MERNPRYVAYAIAHHCTPAMIDDIDKVRYPGGYMTGFIIWMERRISEFKKMTHSNTILDHAAFTDYCIKKGTRCAD